jgi:hypothetical protein
MAGNVVVSNETKPAYATTEFWITVLALATSVVQQAVGLFNISDSRVLLFQSIIVSAYAVARGLAKQGVPNT